MKRLICVLLALTLIASFSVAAFADVITPGGRLKKNIGGNTNREKQPKPYGKTYSENLAFINNPSGAKDVNNPDKVIHNYVVIVLGHSEDSNGNIIVEVQYYDESIPGENTAQVAIEDLSGTIIEKIKGNTNKTLKKANENKSLLGMNAITLSILCVAGGIAVSAAGTVTLIAIKKKNNKNEENTL